MFIAAKPSSTVAVSRAEGVAMAIMYVLHARKVPVTSEEYGKIAAARDMAILERLLRRALTVNSADEMFWEPGVLLAVLEARGVPLTDEERYEITTCTDPDQLEAWLRRALTVSAAGLLFID
ncbi:hypothetical protein [Sphaerisporangium sp. NPDC051011]|uniref:hypothetical protein n=1 Tax=Sphaerisporangium sp. NPDC051011 TaxID=3155792 RepID=UPI0033E0FE38